MKKSTFLIAGKHAVTEALKNPNRKVLKIFLTENSKKNLNKNNQILLIKTKKWSGLYGTPGGKVDYGESLEVALKREDQSITLEPGNQVELSGAKLKSIHLAFLP